MPISSHIIYWIKKNNPVFRGTTSPKLATLNDITDSAFKKLYSIPAQQHIAQKHVIDVLLFVFPNIIFS